MVSSTIYLVLLKNIYIIGLVEHFSLSFLFLSGTRGQKQQNMSYRGLSEKSPETPPSPGKSFSRVDETTINTHWVKVSVTFKLLAFQEGSKESSCAWQVLGILGFSLKI